MRNYLFVALSAVLLLPGCANFSPLTTRRHLKETGAHWLVYDTTRRGAYVRVAADGTQTVCAEPAPDAAYSFANSLKGGVKTPDGTSGDADAALTATLLALAGRDNLVLITREALYRICEMRANGTISQEQTKEMFTSVMTSVGEIAKAQQENAKALQETAKSFSARR